MNGKRFFSHAQSALVEGAFSLQNRSSAVVLLNPFFNAMLYPLQYLSDFSWLEGFPSETATCSALEDVNSGRLYVLPADGLAIHCLVYSQSIAASHHPNPFSIYLLTKQNKAAHCPELDYYYSPRPLKPGII